MVIGQSLWLSAPLKRLRKIPLSRQRWLLPTRNPDDSLKQQLAEQALAVAEANNLTGLSDLLHKELALFQNKQPVRDAQ